MAGVGKKILSLFVEMEDESETKKEVHNVAAAPSQTTPPGTTAIPLNTAAGKKDDTIARSLAEALEKANLDGFDYFEYAKTIDVLKVSIPAEQTLFQTAFASGAVMGAGKQSLLDSARHYIAVLDKEAQKFAISVRQQTSDTVTGKEEQVRTVEESIREKALQIQKLTEEINILSGDKNKIANEIAENRIKIEKVQNDFSATLQTFLGKIRSDIEKIEKYING